MKFLTREVYDSWYGPVRPYEDSGMLDAAYSRYERHIEALEGLLPDKVLELARLPGTDDGLVVEVHHALSQRTLHLILRCGDRQMGYFDLLLAYHHAILAPEDEWTLAKVARSTKDASRHRFDLFFHEVDLTRDGLTEHRLLFHEWTWFSIRCRELEWSRVSRPDRELPRLPDRFPGGPVSRPTCRGRLHTPPPRR